jgi:hypothetical protein
LMGGLIWGAFKVARQDIPAVPAGTKLVQTHKAQGPTPAPSRSTSQPKQSNPATPAESEKKASRGGEVQRREMVRETVPRPAAIGHSASPAAPVKRTFTLAPSPKKVEVFLDGVKQFDLDIGRETIDIPWDRMHVLELRNDHCCQPWTAELGPDKPNAWGDNKIIALLERKLGALTVTVRPPQPDAKIAVLEPDNPNAKLMSVRAGEEVMISFDPRGELRKSLEISVFVGSRIVKKVVDIGAGERMPVSIALD